MAKKGENKKIGLVFFGVGLSLIALSRTKKTDSPSGGAQETFSNSQLQPAFNALAEKYGPAFAKEIEQLYRKETAHFKSGQFLKTFSPGMEVSPGNHEFPYGWASLRDFSNAYKPTRHAPVNANTTFLVPMKESGTGLTKYYVGFPDLFGAIQFVGYTLHKRLHPGYWRSTQKDVADAYRASYKQINTQFT